MYAKTIRAAFISSMPVLMGYLTMGMAFGILLATQVRASNGFTDLVMSIFTISGSMQFAAVDMLRNSENYSLLLDIRLILLTLRILFTRESTEGVKEEPKCS